MRRLTKMHWSHYRQTDRQIESLHCFVIHRHEFTPSSDSLVSIYLSSLCPLALLCQIALDNTFVLLSHSWKLCFFMIRVALCKLHNTAGITLFDWLRRFHILPLLGLVSKRKPSVPRTQTSDSNLSSRNVKRPVI